MNATTSGPTPTPAAATVAACSTSRLMPSRWVSLPARRMTYFEPSAAPVTRKLRLVMPPESGTNVSSPAASSGKRRSALVRSSRSAPRSSSSVFEVMSGGMPVRLGDDRLAGDEVRLGHIGLATLAGGDVVEGADDQDEQ